MMNPEDIIPHGCYCYDTDPITAKITRCQYHSIVDEQPDQLNGYCSYLGVGDWEENGFSHLWDMLKECDINFYLEYENIK